MDRGDWIATRTVLAGAVVSLVVWGNYGGVSTSFICVAGLVRGLVLATWYWPAAGSPREPVRSAAFKTVAT